MRPPYVDWEYNAWGGKYPPFDFGQPGAQKNAELQGRRRFVPGIVLEGGAIDGNGRGTILTTESCLLNPNRNPGLSREQIEAYLRDYSRQKKYLAIGREIAGERHRRSHRPDCRFVNPTTVVVSVCDDQDR